VWKVHFSDFTGGIHTDLRILPVDFTGGIQGEAFVDLRWNRRCSGTARKEEDVLKAVVAAAAAGGSRDY